MSQRVKIDEAAQAAIAEIVGMPWEKDYFETPMTRTARTSLR